MRNFLDRWMPIDASAHGGALDQMNAIVHWLMALLFIGWGIYFIWVLFRYRAGANPKASYEGAKSHTSTYVEVGIVIAEVIILVVFAIPAWARWVTPPDPADDPITVRVIGEQFAWNVHYPGPDGVFGSQKSELMGTSNPIGLDPDDPTGADDIVTINQLHLPVNRPVTVAAQLEGRHPQLRSAGDAGEAGRHPRNGDSGALHSGDADTRRRGVPGLCGRQDLLGDRLRTALRSRSLPDAGLPDGSPGGWIRVVAGLQGRLGSALADC